MSHKTYLVFSFYYGKKKITNDVLKEEKEKGEFF